MRFTTRTEYGLVCLVNMARLAPGSLITVADLVKHERMPETYIQKIFLALRAANIVTSHSGRNGGYVLARAPEKITIKEIIEALEGGTFEVFCEPDTRKGIVCTHFASRCAVMPVWVKTKGLLDDLYSSITLDTIAKDSASGHHPAAENKLPLSN